MPSWSLLGYRYFLSAPVTDAPYGVVFSDDSPWSLERFSQAREGKASREGVLYFEVPANYDPDAAPRHTRIASTSASPRDEFAARYSTRDSAPVTSNVTLR